MNIVVRKMQRSQTFSAELHVSLTVVFFLAKMHIPIHFDHQNRLVTVEVDDIVVDDMPCTPN